MSILELLSERWAGIDRPFLIDKTGEFRFNELLSRAHVDLSLVEEGDVVAVIGDLDYLSILSILKLIDLKTVIVPLTHDTQIQHEEFFEIASVDVVLTPDGVVRRKFQTSENEIIHKLRKNKSGGLILFSSGTTGSPKGIVHDLTLFLKRFETKRPSFTTLNFLLFDHIGGLNTLFHTLFNVGTIVSVKTRTVDEVLHICSKYQVEILPTTPTFLRMMALSDNIADKIPKSLKIVTYGTEMMDQFTLDHLCNLLPQIDFRQTYGMSEMGILRIKSKSKDSLFMRVGGEGVSTKIVKDILYIKSQTRMLGYLNAPDPFDSDGWFCTKDVVEQQGDFVKIIGRESEIINVGGLKFLPSEVESVALKFPGVKFVKADGKPNPITGQHVELLVHLEDEGKFRVSEFKDFLSRNLAPHLRPLRIKYGEVSIGHRFKRL